MSGRNLRQQDFWYIRFAHQGCTPSAERDYPTLQWCSDPKLVERGPVVDPYTAVVLACSAMNLAKVYVGGDLLVDTYHSQKNDMSKVSREVNQRVAHLH